MVGRANLNIRLAICVLVLSLAGPVWNFTTVRGQALCDYPPDGVVIPGGEYEYPPDSGNWYIYTELIFAEGPTAVNHTGYFSDDYSKVASRHPDANLGPPPYAYVSGLEYTYFAGKPDVPPADETLVRGTKYYWTVDETDADDHTFPGNIWEFTIQGFYAFAPNPPDGATIDDRTPALEWIAGVNADYHELYFSTNYDDVKNRNPHIKQITTDPCRPYPAIPGLELGETYYWLVDEVKSSPTERWNARTVWSFTISECLSLDNMEDYNDRDDIREVWRDGYADVVWGGTYPYLWLVQGGSSGSNLNVSTAVGSSLQGNTGPIHGGSQAMVLRFDNDGWTYKALPGEEKWVYDAPYYSEIEANTVGTNSLGVGQTWDSEGIKSLSVSFQGHPISDGFYDVGAWPAYTIYGRGRDIRGRHDEFYFLSQYPFVGVGSIQTEVLSMDNTDPWAKAGVMIREKWTPYSKYAAVFITPGRGVTFQYRDSEDGPTTTITKPGVTAPQYVRLVRNISGAFEAYHGDNSTGPWYDVNAPGAAPVFPEIPMGTIDDPNIYVGSAVSSHNANQICAADFNNLLVSPQLVNWIYGNIGTNDPEQMYVALSDGTTTAVVEHPDPNAATLTSWQEWNIALSDFNTVNLDGIKKVYIGFGDRANPVQGGSGTVYIDNIRLYKPGPLFVDAGAPAGGKGSSWATAYKYLQDALAYADSNPDVNEIWVAAGIYKPDANTTNPGGTNYRTATFQLKNGVGIYGGFPSGGTWAQRDPQTYQTILSGDINTPGDANDNSYHVVTGGGTELNAVLDGFTITAGNANGSYPYNCGGGVFNDSSSPTVTNCTFSDNSAQQSGGGMYNAGGSPTLVHCRFAGNSSDSMGGGIYNNNSSSTVMNCTFSDNEAVYGGGMVNVNGSVLLSNCSFIGNSSILGGGMFNQGGAPTVINCVFSGNSATWNGGGINNDNCDPTITNCTFSGNTADYGGGIFNYLSDAAIANCILWANTAPNGAQIYDWTSSPTVTYSGVEGSYPGLGNIDSDPNFVDPNGPDGIAGTEDDDLRLSAGSPCIDVGDNTAVPVEVETDLDGHPRIIDGDCNDTEIVDMGAYEFAYAYIGDFDGECDVDFVDYAIFALAWLTEPGQMGWNPDCDISIPADNSINWRDLDILSNNWLAGL